MAEKWIMDLIENIKKGDTKTFTCYKLDEIYDGRAWSWPMLLVVHWDTG